MKKRITIITYLLAALILYGCRNVPINIPADNSKEEVDIDITSLSSENVSLKVSDIISNPQEYIGKTIKINGFFINYKAQDKSTSYPTCIIIDAIDCCPQGIIFTTDDEIYPEEGTSIIVTGVFNILIDKTSNQECYCLENAVYKKDVSVYV